MTKTVTPKTILHFWFTEHGQKEWFQKDPSFDQKIRNNFLEIHLQATKGELFTWRKLAEGRLAEIIILDQFSRNIFRDDPQSFTTDSLALILAQEAIYTQADQQLESTQRQFIYMPFMHSESLIIHKEATKLFKTLDIPEVLKYEYIHQDIIKTFGRYPHRNKILNRNSTQPEIDFLKTPNSSF